MQVAASDEPVFWLDAAGKFASALSFLELGRSPEPLNAEISLRLRVKEDADCFPLSGRLLYLRDRDSLQPLAEIAHCFGRICEVDLLDILRESTVEMSPENIDFVNKHAAALIAGWDQMPRVAFEQSNIIDGLAAAIVGLETLDPVDLAVARLQQRYTSYRKKVETAEFGDGRLSAEQLDVVKQSLSKPFGLSGSESLEHQLLRLALLADMIRTDRGRALVGDLLPKAMWKMGERLADRLAADAKVLRAVHGELDSIAESLGVGLEALDDETLLQLRLIPLARDIAVQRIRNALASVDPQNAHTLLLSLSDAIMAEEALGSYRSALQCFSEMESATVANGSGERGAEWFIDQYADRWYRVDELYRRAMPAVQGGVRSALQTAYRKWLRDLNSPFSRALEDRETWVFPTLRGISESPSKACLLELPLSLWMRCDLKWHTTWSRGWEDLRRPRQESSLLLCPALQKLG